MIVGIPPMERLPGLRLGGLDTGTPTRRLPFVVVDPVVSRVEPSVESDSRLDRTNRSSRGVTRTLTPKCVTCGSELHPERAEKYNYCTSRECQEKNARGLTIVSVGLNKAADQYHILDDQTRRDLASGRHHDQRRATYGSLDRPSDQAQPSGSARGDATTTVRSTTGDGPTGDRPPRRYRRPAQPVRRVPWTRSQQKLAMIYHQQGLRPDEIARKLGVSRYLATQMILAGKKHRTL